MISLAGNSILIADPDSVYGVQLAETLTRHGASCFRAEHISGAKDLLKKYDFDLVISNYYLSDGIIHQLIDWSTNNLLSLPVFTCIGYPYAGDSGISQKYSIAEIFSKNDSRKIISSLSRLLFDFNQFEQSLLESVIPSEIMIEIHVGGTSHLVKPIEITEDSLYMQLDFISSIGSFGILKFSILSNNQNQNFLIPGLFEGRTSENYHFKINPKYLKNWGKFLNYLNVKQLNVTNFLNKASGF